MTLLSNVSAGPRTNDFSILVTRPNTIYYSKHLIANDLEKWVGCVPVEELLVATQGDYNAAMRVSIVRAKQAIKLHAQNEKRMHREILKNEVVVERGRRARGGVNFSLKGEVRSLLDKASTRSSTTSVNDLAFMLLPSLNMTVPKKTEGEWADAWN